MRRDIVMARRDASSIFTNLRMGNKCKGCDQHVKYLRHRVAPLHEWVVVPLARVRERSEGKRLEDLLVAKWPDF